MPAPLSVILAVWNQWPLTHACLRSLARQDLGDATLEIIVVDNGSTDGSVEALRAEHPAVRVLEMGGNTGFAVANNRGAAVATGEWILLLNNDTELEPDALRTLLAAVRDHSDFRLAAPQMVRFGTPDVVDNRGIWLDWAGLFRQVDSGRASADGPRRAEVFGPSGGAALIHRSVLDAVGLFDESLFAYLEDGDFACRARAAGFRCLYVADAVVRHHGSATAESMGDWKTSQIHRNLARLRHRWVRGSHFSVVGIVERVYVAMHYVRAWREGRVAVLRNARAEGLALARADAAAGRSPGAADRRCVREWIGVAARPVEGRA